MHKYLYLTNAEWIQPWVNGGRIPIVLASTYLGKKRDGIYTPDENRIHESPIDIANLKPILDVGENVSIKSFTMTNCTVNGQPLPDIIDAKYYIEDGLVLSFCNRKSGSIARRLGKRACVKIFNIYKLKECIDEQLGVDSVMGECMYTADHRRNHFLKSVEDGWQDEYRLFWPLSEPRWVKLRRGFGKSVKLHVK